MILSNFLTLLTGKLFIVLTSPMVGIQFFTSYIHFCKKKSLNLIKYWISSNWTIWYMTVILLPIDCSKFCHYYFYHILTAFNNLQHVRLCQRNIQVVHAHLNIFLISAVIQNTVIISHVNLSKKIIYIKQIPILLKRIFFFSFLYSYVILRGIF